MIISEKEVQDVRDNYEETGSVGRRKIFYVVFLGRGYIFFQLDWNVNVFLETKSMHDDFLVGKDR